LPIYIARYIFHFTKQAEDLAALMNWWPIPAITKAKLKKINTKLGVNEDKKCMVIANNIESLSLI